MVTAYTGTPDSSQQLPLSSAVIAMGADEASVPETAETPSPPNTATDDGVEDTAAVQAGSVPAPFDVIVSDVGDLANASFSGSIPDLEDMYAVSGSGLPDFQPLLSSSSPIPLPYITTPVGPTSDPGGIDVKTPPPEIIVVAEPDLTPEYIIDMLNLLEEFKKTLQELPARSGPPFRVADGETFDRILQFLVKLTQEGFDGGYKQCSNFIQENLFPAFSKLYTDDSVSSWTTEAHGQIFRRSQQAIRLIALKMGQDCFGLLDLLHLLLNPMTRFMGSTFNKHSVTFEPVLPHPTRLYSNSMFPAASSSDLHKSADLKSEEDLIPEDVYARCFDNRCPKGYVVDYLTAFGRAGGFDALQRRICEASETNPLTIALLVALLKPFGTCGEYLATRTVERYFLKIFEVVPRFLETMSDEDFKKESGKQDGKTDPVTTILKTLQMLAKRLPDQEATITQAIELARLSSLTKLLRISTYNGKMHALNEINRIIGTFSFSHRPFLEEDATVVGPDKLAKWLLDNRLLSVILSDNMHSPQYVDKLDKLIRFLIKEKSLTTEDLDDLWAAQIGKHEAIVKNVHDLLTKLAWDFTPSQLDHLFGHFQGSWISASRRQREKLLELIRRLAEDDKEGVMAEKVLDLLWSLSHNEELPTEIMDQALTAHLKIIDYTCSQDKDALKMNWLRKCVQEIKTNTWVIPALRHIKCICDQYPESNNNMGGIGSMRSCNMPRSDVLKRLIQEDKIIDTVSSSLEQYLEQARFVWSHQGEPRSFDPMTQDLLGSKFSHFMHVDERLTFLRYVLQQGSTYLEDPYKLWTCLAEHPVFPCDRDLCFKWFTKLMASTEHHDILPTVIKEFFETKVLMLDPACLTESGLECFSRFLYYVNVKERKLEARRKQHYLQDVELIGIDYLWKIILTCNEETSQLGINLLRDLYASPSLHTNSNLVTLHTHVVTECIDRLRPIHDNLSVLVNDKDYRNKIQEDGNKAVRILKVLTEYIQQHDREHNAERLRPPLSRATYGAGFYVTIKSNPNHTRPEEIELVTHTNDTIGGLRRQIYQRYRVSPGVMKLDLFYNNELLQQQHDRRLFTDLGFDHTLERPIITVKVAGASAYHGGGLPDMTAHSSPDSSNDISPVDTPQGGDILGEAASDTENLLPGVWLASQTAMVEEFVRFADLGSRLCNLELVTTARNLLGLLPADERVVMAIQNAAADTSVSLDSVFQMHSPSKVLYNLQVLQSLLLPARLGLFDDAATFCAQFISRRPLLDYILEMLTRNNFIQDADTTTKQQCYQCVLRLVKLVLHIMFAVCAESSATLVAHSLSHPNQPLPANALAALRRGFTDETLLSTGNVRNGFSAAQAVSEYGIRMIAAKVCLLYRTAALNAPKLDTLKALRHLAWTAASGSLCLLECPEADARSALQKITSPLSQADLMIAEEALDCFLLCFPLTPKSVDNVITQKHVWLPFFDDMLIVCKEPGIRRVAMQHFAVIGTKCTSEQQHLDNLLITHFFQSMQRESKLRPETCDEVFRFLAVLLQSFGVSRQLPEVDNMLRVELDWLEQCRKHCAEGGRSDVHDTLLEGHLLLIKELVRILHPRKKRGLRSKENRPLLIQELIEDFLFPTARVLLKMVRSRHNSLSSRPSSSSAFGGPSSSVVSSSVSSSDLFDAAYSDPLALLEMPSWARPICQSPASINAAFEVIAALCLGSPDNLTILNETLTLLFYSESESPITEWEFSPPIGPRRTDGFVGLKNAGATCYMNSVLQQLYMIPVVRNGILTIEGVGGNYAEDDMEEKGDGDGPQQSGGFVGPLLPLPFCVPDDMIISAGGDCKADSPPMDLIPVPAAKTPAAAAQDYNAGLIKQLQVLFSHLACSKLQFFIPRGFWKHFRMGNEPVNLREQHDAMEFYNQVVDCVDEGLKSAQKPPLMGAVLRGYFADQKICKDCPHRYSRTESFTSLSLDIRNFHTLQDTLEHYVKGDLLEGANAYTCEKCNRKVDTIKRLCIKQLPQILTIQLKRFDYDWEREQPIKFNDYFEFPREIDMEPYTAAGLAKSDGFVIQDEEDIIREVEEASGMKPRRSGTIPPPSSHYRLVGIVVHSGQATGGHYYSFILDRDGEQKWYRFDDGEVSECKLDEDDELKTQCFGEESPGKKQWWNAYLLFYERIDAVQKPPNFHERARLTGRIRMQSESIGAQIVHMIPTSLRNMILKQNLKFMHSRSQFIPEYFAFLRRLLVNSSLYLPAAAAQYDQAERNLQHLRHQQQLNGHQLAQNEQQQQLMARTQQEYHLRSLLPPEEIDACCLAVVQLMGKFMFDVCFRTRRNLRGPAHEWSEALSKLLVQSASARHFFTEHVLFKHSKRMVEFLLECPNQDVRNGFARILAHVASHGHGDRPCPPSAIRAANLVGYHFPTEPESLEDLIILACMSLTQRKDFSDHSRQISNFFQLFNLINSGGLDQVRTLIRLGLPELLIRIAIDEVPYSLFKYNAHHELGKLFSLVCTLVLHIDFSDTRSTSETDPEGGFIAPNPFALEQPSHVPASRELCDLFLLNSNFTKKLVEDGLQLEEVRTALKYLCWENQPFTVRVIYAILGVLSQQYPSGDLRVLLDFAFTFIQMNDSLLCFRLLTFFHGVPSDSAEGLLANIHRNQTSHPRRAYLCFKFTLTMLSIDNMGYFLQPQSKDTNEFKTVFIETCEWLERELSSSGGRSGGYYNGPRNYYNSNFNSWNHNIVISNESSNGIHLERSDSVRNLLDRAYEYYPVEPNGDTALPTISATIDGDEEEDDDSAVTFSAADSTNPGDLDDDLEAAPRSRGGATDTWRSSSGDIYGRRGGGAGESLTGLGGPSSSCAASSSGAGRPMFGSGRRNASVQDVMKGNLISSGIFPAAATRGDALDPEQDDVLDDMETLDTADHRDSGKISECLQGLQLSGGGAASRSGAGSDTTDPFAMESYRPGTPQEGTAEEFFGFCPK